MHPGDGDPSPKKETTNEVKPLEQTTTTTTNQQTSTAIAKRNTSPKNWNLLVTKKSKSYKAQEHPPCFNPDCTEKHGGNKWAVTPCENDVATNWNLLGVDSVNLFFENYGDDLGNYKEGALWDAYYQFRNATKADPNCVNAYTNHAIVAAKLGRFDEALATLVKVEPRLDDHPIIAIYKGVILESKGQKKEALQAWGEALARNEKLFEHYFGIIMKPGGSNRYREYDNAEERVVAFNLFFFKQFFPVAFHNYAQLNPGTPDYFIEHKFIILRKIVHPYPLRYLQGCYHNLIKKGRLKLGDPQAKRYTAYNSRCISHFHWTFTDLVRRVVAHAAKPTYTYFGGYVEGSFLQPHTDRFQCEFTFSMSLQNEPWDEPWLLSLGHKPKFHRNDNWPGKNPEKMPPESEIVDADLFAGDALLFMGRHLIHFRRGKLKENEWTNQVFMHFVQEDFSKSMG